MKHVAICLLAIFLSPVLITAQTTVPNTFSSGNPISAAEMNANFVALVNAVNALQTSMATVQALFPKGSIVATFTPPDANGNYMAGSTDWAFADGTLPADVASTYLGQFPDLRGQFVRGVNAGRADGLESPDFASRTGGDLNKAGSFEDDAFQGHFHNFKIDPKTAADASTIVVSGNPAISSTSGYGNRVFEPTSDGTHGTPRVSSETRPSNVAVYWYIKVR